MEEQYNKLEDLKGEIFIEEDNQDEDNAVSKTEVYENISRDIQQAIQQEVEMHHNGPKSIQNNPPVKSPWSNYDKKAYADAAILATITLIFGIIFMMIVLV